MVEPPETTLLDALERVRDELLTPMDLFKRRTWMGETAWWLTALLIKNGRDRDAESKPGPVTEKP